jgi:hypothetical protein
MDSAADRGGTISTRIRLARRRALDIEARWTMEDAQATGPPNDHPDRVEARWRAIHGTLGVNQRSNARRGSIVTSTSSFLPRRAASAGKMIEDTCQKAVAAAGGPVRVAVCTLTVPIEVARSTYNILRLTEELLEEVVFLLRSMRPVVEAVSTTQQADNFDAVSRTLEQIQNSARTPIGVVRSVLAPVRPSRGGSPPVIEAEPLQTPGVIRIASITVTMPSVTLGKPSRSLSLPG